jgi:tetratricopeptide (TPR) repeat protein
MIELRMAGEYEESYQFARDELARDNDDSWQRFQFIKAAHLANRPVAAIEAFEELQWDPIVPSAFRFKGTQWIADCYHLLGRHEDELRIVRDFLAAGPQMTDGSSLVFPELLALAALGRHDELDRKIGALLLRKARPVYELHVLTAELRAHGFPNAASKMGTRALDAFDHQADDGDRASTACRHCYISARAGLLVSCGRAEQAYSEVRSAVESGVPAHPGGNWDGDVAYFGAVAGDVTRAREAFERWRNADHESEYGALAYETARIHAVLGNREEAIEALRQAVHDGFYRWNELHREFAFEGLREDPEFQDIMRPKG